MSERAEWDGMALVGVIARAHGNRGDVIVNPETDFLDERFRSTAELRTWRRGKIETVVVETARVQQGRPVLHLRGIDTIEAAEALAGCELRVPVAELAVLGDGQFYRHDLVGCRVETSTGTIVGTVDYVDSDTGNDRLVVQSIHGEVLIPLAAPIVVRIEPAASLIVIDPPEGLLDLNRPASRERGRRPQG
jgi:16S rRNA processing protein RimM